MVLFSCDEKHYPKIFYRKTGRFANLFSDFLDISDPVLVFDEFMEGIDLEKYLKVLPEHKLSRIRYNPVNMLKTVLFGFMQEGYISLRSLQDSCRVNIRYMYLMDHETPSYRTFSYFITNVLGSSIEDIFYDINRILFEKEQVDLNHVYFLLYLLIK